MDTLAVGMKDTLVWEVTEKLTTTRGEFKVFSTPSMTLLVEMAAHKVAEPHLKPGQGQVGLSVNIRHMAPTPIGKQVRAEAELTGIDPASPEGIAAAAASSRSGKATIWASESPLAAARSKRASRASIRGSFSASATVKRLLRRAVRAAQPAARRQAR